MGTDIHAALEIRKNGKWETQLSPNKWFGKYDDEPRLTARFDVGGRNYDLFAILADVRNGHGFAGCDTGDGFVPISEPKGLPDDMDEHTREALSDEHTPSYVTLTELLDYDWSQTTKHRGWVTAVEFEEWDRMKEWEPAPKSYCGRVSGATVEHVSLQEMRKRVNAIIKRHQNWAAGIEEIKQTMSSVYCLVEWTEQYSDSAGHFWTITMPKLMQLGKQYGNENVRLVFDFDS